MARTLKNLVEDVLGFQRAKALWTANYYPALPIAPQAFEIGAILPAMLYMARFGHRRGKGRFVETFGREVDGKAQPPNLADVAAGLLARRGPDFEGFEDELGQAVLGDLLLAWCLENRKHAEGHDEQVQRIYPTHYLASWIDLPASVVHLRGVPELLTILLAQQDQGEWLEPGGRGHFPVGVSHGDNCLLSLFGRHMAVRGSFGSDLASDTFIEDQANDLGIDELLAARLAQACGSAPHKAKGKDEGESIPNSHPLAQCAANSLREDLALFIEVYGRQVPRQAFLQMLEAGIALGLTNLLLSTAQMLAEWERGGQVPLPERQTPWPLFVDCSQGQDRALRGLSESSMTECLRRYERLPVTMMLLRVLDQAARHEEDIRQDLPPEFPDATDRINFLGDLYQGQHPEAPFLLRSLKKDCVRLADKLEEEGESPDVVAVLKDSERNAALRLAEALCDLIGNEQQGGFYRSLLESFLMSDAPNGLALKRRIRRTQNGSSRTLILRATSVRKSYQINSTGYDFLAVAFWIL